MLRPNYKLLFHFENDQMSVVEIKLNGIAAQDPASIYQWLFYDKINDMLSALEFKSMRNEGNKEFRTFGSAAIEFDSKQAIFTEKDKTYTLTVMTTDSPLQPALKEAIGDYLLLRNFRSERI